jgi:hypothetical protein
MVIKKKIYINISCNLSVGGLAASLGAKELMFDSCFGNCFLMRSTSIFIYFYYFVSSIVY